MAFMVVGACVGVARGEIGFLVAVGMTLAGSFAGWVFPALFAYACHSETKRWKIRRIKCLDCLAVCRLRDAEAAAGIVPSVCASAPKLKVEACEVCGLTKPGNSYVFYYGHKLGTRSWSEYTPTGFATTEETRYRMAGSDSAFICTRCIRVETLRSIGLFILSLTLPLVLLPLFLWLGRTVSELFKFGALICACCAAGAVGGGLGWLLRGREIGSKLAIELRKKDLSGRGFSAFLTPHRHDRLTPVKPS